MASINLHIWIQLVNQVLNLKNTGDALPQLVTKDTLGLFDKYRILNPREMHGRYEVFLENYNKTINVEGNLMVLMANRYILPAALSSYQKDIAESVAAVRSAGGRTIQGKKLPASVCSITAPHRRRSTRSPCATGSFRP